MKQFVGVLQRELFSLLVLKWMFVLLDDDFDAKLYIAILVGIDIIFAWITYRQLRPLVKFVPLVVALALTGFLVYALPIPLWLLSAFMAAVFVDVIWALLFKEPGPISLITGWATPNQTPIQNHIHDFTLHLRSSASFR